MNPFLRISFFLLSFLLCSVSLFAQSTWETWMPHVRHYSLYDWYEVSATPDSGAVVAGFINAAYQKGPSGFYELNEQGDSTDLKQTAVPFQSQGNTLFYSHRVRGIEYLPGNQYALFGDYYTAYTGGDTAGFVAVFDQNDSCLWAYTFNGAGTSRAEKLQALPGGEMQLAVVQYSGTNPWYRNNCKAHAVRLSATGQARWTQTFATQENGSILAMEPAPNEGSYVLYQIGQMLPTFNFIFASRVARLDSAGQILWTRSVDNLLALDIAAHSNGELYVLSEDTASTQTQFKNVLTRLSPAGNVMAAWRYDGALSWFEQLEMTTNNDLLMAGSANQINGLRYPCLMQVNYSGQPVWARRYNTGPTFVHDGPSRTWIDQGPDGHLILGAIFYYFSPRQVGTDYGLWMAKADPWGRTYCNENLFTVSTQPTTTSCSQVTPTLDTGPTISSDTVNVIPSVYYYFDQVKPCLTTCNLGVIGQLSQDTVCSGTPVTGTTILASGQTAQWYIDSYSQPIGTGDSATWVATTNGNHQMILEITESNCLGAMSFNINVGGYDPAFGLGADTSLCPGSTLTLDPGAFSGAFLWENGDTNTTRSITQPGTYWVDWTGNSGCTQRDSISIGLFTLPQPNLGQDTGYCMGDSVSLYVGGTAGSFLWNDGYTLPTRHISQPGLYWVDWTDPNGCTARDSVLVTPWFTPQPTLLSDPGFCTGDSLILSTATSWPGYLWQDSSSQNQQIVTTGGQYWVQVTDVNGCLGRDTIQVDEWALPMVSFGWTANNLTVTFADSTAGAANWNWDFGDGTTGTGAAPLHTYLAPGTYLTCLTIENQFGCSDVACDTVVLSMTGLYSRSGSSLKVYPVPAQEFLIVEANHLEKGEIWDALGRQVFQEKMLNITDRIEIKCSDWPAGGYWLKVETAEGVESLTIWVEGR